MNRGSNSSQTLENSARPVTAHLPQPPWASHPLPGRGTPRQQLLSPPKAHLQGPPEPQGSAGHISRGLRFINPQSNFPETGTPTHKASAGPEPMKGRIHL